MSFRCQKCHHAQPPCTPQNKLTVKTREVTYTNEAGETIAKGTQIVEEIAVCKKCFEANQKPKDTEPKQEQPQVQPKPAFNRPRQFDRPQRDDRSNRDNRNNRDNRR